LQIEIQVEGNSCYPWCQAEAGLNTGIFEAIIGMMDQAVSLGHPLNAGGRLKITYFDNMETPLHTSSAIMNIL